MKAIMMCLISHLFINSIAIANFKCADADEQLSLSVVQSQILSLKYTVPVAAVIFKDGVFSFLIGQAGKFIEGDDIFDQYSFYQVNAQNLMFSNNKKSIFKLPLNCGRGSCLNIDSPTKEASLNIKGFQFKGESYDLICF